MLVLFSPLPISTSQPTSSFLKNGHINSFLYNSFFRPSSNHGNQNTLVPHLGHKVAEEACRSKVDFVTMQEHNGLGAMGAILRLVQSFYVFTVQSSLVFFLF